VPGAIREKLIWFAGRRQMDIEGLGEKTIDQIRTQSRSAEHFATSFGSGPSERTAGPGAHGREEGAEPARWDRGGKSRGLARVLAGMGIGTCDATAKLWHGSSPTGALLGADEPMLRPRR